MRMKVLLLAFFNVLLLAVIPIVLSYGDRLADTELKAMKGELLPFEVDTNKLIEIQCGGVTVGLTFDQMSRGFNLSRSLSFGFDYPFRISLKQKRFFVSVNITNAEGLTVAKIVDNQWAVNNDPLIAYDRNYNAYAFEVIDSDQLPVFQVIFAPQNRMYLGGFFYVENGRLLLTGNSTIFNPLPEEVSSSLPRIFKYSSAQHLGEMVVESTYQVAKFSSRVYTIAYTLICFEVPMGTYLIYVGIYGQTQKRKRRQRWRKKAERHRKTKSA